MPAPAIMSSIERRMSGRSFVEVNDRNGSKAGMGW